MRVDQGCLQWRNDTRSLLDCHSRLASSSRPSGEPLLHAIGIYFDTLLIHPLPDGNGRLARLLFQAALRQTIGLSAPVFPLGPACAANRPALIAAYLAWEFDRNAQPLVDSSLQH